MKCFSIKTFILSFLVPIVLSAKCVTPHGEEAECLSIRLCPVLIEALISLRPQAIEFVKKSQCGQAKDPLVCCGTSANESSSQNASSNPPTKAKTKRDLLPSRRFCGYQRFDDYFHTDNDTVATALDQFPWSAALIYEEDGDRSIKCSGSLISDRYVLTAAHCIRIFQNSAELVGVTLGEHNVESEEDCIKDERFDDECSDPVADFTIEEKVIHPGYDLKRRAHDIGLIRLNRTVVYSDFIRPICLPFASTKFAKIGDVLYQSGFGAGWFSKPSDIKKKITVKLLPNERCHHKFEDRGFTFNITDYHTCTIENDYRTSTCQGDSGGPVMFSHRHQWHQEGIISLGKFCGFGDGHGFGNPNVNVNVAKYLDWILESVHP